MSPLRMVAFSNLSRQKTQAFLVGLSTAITVFLFSLALSLLSSLQSPYQRMFSRLSGSHINYIIDRKFYDIDQMLSWWRLRSEVKAAYSTPLAYITEGFNIVKGSKRVNQRIYLTEYDPSAPSDKLEMLDGHTGSVPGPSELWVPNTTAQALKLSLGDALELPTDQGMKSFTISAIILDPAFSASSMLNPSRMWVGGGELAYHYRPENLRWSFLSIRLVAAANTTSELSAFNQHMGGAVNGMLYEYNMLLGVFSTFFSIFSISLTVLAFLTLVIAAFSIYTSISGSIAADYRRIGILKALGFTPFGIIQLYGFQYFLISLIASPPALFAAFLMNGFLRRQFLSQMGVAGPGISMLPLFSICFAAALIVVPSLACFFSRKAGAIKVVEAIRLGESSSRIRKKSPLALRRAMALPLALVLSVKQIFAQKRRSFANALTVFFAAFIVLFGVDTAAYLGTSAHNASLWGADSSDLTVIRSGKRFSVERERLWAELLQDARVLKVVPTAFAAVGLPSIDERPSEQLYGTVIDGDFDQAGYTLLKGRSPKTPREIAVAYNSFTAMGGKLGQALSVVIAGKKVDFDLVGVYQSVNNFGKGFRMLKSGFRRGDPSFEIDEGNIFLREDVDSGKFMADIEARYGEAVDATDPSAEMARNLNQVLSLFASAFLFFILIILVSIFAVIFNNTAIELVESRRSFGVYKTLGMTPLGMRLLICSKNALIGFTAALCGCLAAFIFQEPLASFIFSVLGLKELDMPLHFGGAAATLVGLCIFAGASAWIPSRALKTLNVRELIVE